jgi:uncharacterized protein YdaU (DUF1376 family)
VTPQDVAKDGGESKTGKRQSKRETELWYKRYPTRFRKATSHLSYDLRCQYSDLLDLFYDHDGPLPNDDKWIACQLFCDVRKWRPIRKALETHGLLCVGEDGLLHQKTVDQVLEERSNKLSKVDIEHKKPRLGAMAIPRGSSLGSSGGSSLGSCPGSSGDFSETPNAINGGVQKPRQDTRASRSKIGDLREERGLSKEEGSCLEGEENWHPVGIPVDPPDKPPHRPLRLVPTEVAA